MKSKSDFNSKEEYHNYLRTYFAGLAMQGLFSDNSRTYRSANEICIDALEVADELLNQLETK